MLTPAQASLVDEMCLGREGPFPRMFGLGPWISIPQKNVVFWCATPLRPFLDRTWKHLGPEIREGGWVAFESREKPSLRVEPEACASQTCLKKQAHARLV